MREARATDPTNLCVVSGTTMLGTLFAFAAVFGALEPTNVSPAFALLRLALHGRLRARHRDRVVERRSRAARSAVNHARG